jgi:hypothetical protein
MIVGLGPGARPLGVALISVLVSGCGTPDAPSAAPTSPESVRSTVERSVVSAATVTVASSQPPVSQPPDVSTSGVGVPTTEIPNPSAGNLPLCEDVPPAATDVIGSNLGGQDVDPAFLDVVNAYVAEHVDTFGGMWLDRDAGGTFVVAFTGDPEAHRSELAGRRPRAVDDAGVVDDRPLGEWGQPFDVVQVKNTETGLLATLNEVSDLLEDHRDKYVGAGVDAMRNRVRIDLIEPRLPPTWSRSPNCCPSTGCVSPGHSSPVTSWTRKGSNRATRST